MEDEKHTHESHVCNIVHIIFQYKTKVENFIQKLVAFALICFFLPTSHFSLLI